MIRQELQDASATESTAGLEKVASLWKLPTSSVSWVPRWRPPEAVFVNEVVSKLHWLALSEEARFSHRKLLES